MQAAPTAAPRGASRKHLP